MKHIKHHEYYKPYVNENGLEVGDFVQIKTNYKFYGFKDPEKIKNIVNTQIGRISSFERGTDIIVNYYIGMAPYPTTLRFTYKDIVEFGKTKEEVEMKINAKKYNL